MNHAAEIAMFGWIPVALALFALLPTRRAVLWAFLLAWLFLPFARYPIAGLPDYTKVFATCGFTILLAAAFDFRHFVSLRPRLADLPIVVYCLCPFASSVTSGLGVHDGISAVFDTALTWGAPYALGRLYFENLKELRSLALGFAVAALAYMPLCFFELANGPELHHRIYGYYQPFLDQELRYGILRPMVFLDSGLMLAVWMAALTVAGAWLWKSRAFPSRWQRWAPWLVPLMAVTTAALRSANGWVLMTIGLSLLALHSYKPSAMYLVVLMTVVPIYATVRATGMWSGEQAVPVVETIMDASRAQSILFRLRNEDTIIENMRERPLFGFGRQGAAVSDHRGGIAVRDSLWIIAFSQSGAIGLASLLGVLLVPIAIFVRSIPASRWLEASAAPAAALAIVLLLYSLDDLANAMVNPVYMLIAGGLTGLRECRQTS